MLKKIKVAGKGLDFGKTNQYNEILVDCRRVHLKDHKLRCSVKSPPRCSAMVKLNDNGDGTYTLQYKPTFTGVYQVNVRVDEQHVKGSPFDVAVKS